MAADEYSFPAVLFMKENLSTTAFKEEDSTRGQMDRILMGRSLKIGLSFVFSFVVV